MQAEVAAQTELERVGVQLQARARYPGVREDKKSNAVVERIGAICIGNIPSQYQKRAGNRFNAALTKKIHLNRQSRISYLRQSGFTESFYTASLHIRHCKWQLLLSQR